MVKGMVNELKKKIAIATDSNSGITQAQAKELGIFVLPMPFILRLTRKGFMKSWKVELML